MRRADVELTGEDFDARRKIIDLLDGQIKLTVKDGQKVVYISRRLGRGKLLTMKQKGVFYNEQTS